MVTKRTQNAAHIRYKIINYVVETCKHKEFDSIYVTDICKASNISKVTFFKYFDRKEDVLLLYKSIINYGICIEVSKRKLHARAGLEYVIDRFANIIRGTPSIALGLITTILHSKPPILPVILSESDKALFFPDHSLADVNILPFWDLVEGFMLEAILNKDITIMSNAADLTALFMSNLYGGIVISHFRNKEHQAVYFNNTMRNWLRCL